MSDAVATVLAAAIPSLIQVVALVWLHRVKQDVRTLNESSVGQLAAADETRRIERIPKGDRTAKEQRHIDTAPQNNPPPER